MQIALTHKVSPNINQCELSYLNRQPIDVQLATKQHESYCNLLRKYDLQVIELSVNLSHPDATFIEDTAVVVDEIAVMASMGTESRRDEVERIEPVLAQYRKTTSIRPPATLEGGDVLQIGKSVFVGISPRTNRAGIQALREILAPFGYRIVPVGTKDCLHLKSACTSLDDHTILANPAWLDLKPFDGFKIITVPEDEPWAANVLRLGDIIIAHSGFKKTAALIQTLGFPVDTVDISQLQKAEAALTCSSILFHHPV